MVVDVAYAPFLRHLMHYHHFSFFSSEARWKERLKSNAKHGHVTKQALMLAFMSTVLSNSIKLWQQLTTNSNVPGQPLDSEFTFYCKFDKITFNDFVEPCFLGLSWSMFHWSDWFISSDQERTPGLAWEAHVSEFDLCVNELISIYQFHIPAVFILGLSDATSTWLHAWRSWANAHAAHMFPSNTRFCWKSIRSISPCAQVWRIQICTSSIFSFSPASSSP